MNLNRFEGNNISSDRRFDVLLKIMLIGDPAVGKTSIMTRFCDQVFNPSYIHTVGLDFKQKIIEHCGKRVKIQVWDTAGQDRFNTLVTAYYRGASGIMLVYDITNLESFNHVTRWITNVENHAKLDVEKVIVANKVDLVHRRVVNVNDGQQLALKYNASYIETSAKLDTNIEKAFIDLAQTILINKMPNSEKANGGGDIIRPNKEYKKTKKRCIRF